MHPSDAIGVESVDGFVEDEMAQVTEHCGRQAESLFHAQRSRRLFGGDRFGQRKQAFVGVVDGADRAGPEVRASSGSSSAGVEHGADDSGRCTVAGQRAAIDEGFAVVDAVGPACSALLVDFPEPLGPRNQDCPSGWQHESRHALSCGRYWCFEHIHKSSDWRTECSVAPKSLRCMNFLVSANLIT